MNAPDSAEVKSSRKNAELIIGALLCVGLYLRSRYNYLLFHGIAELFSVIIAVALFITRIINVPAVLTGFIAVTALFLSSVFFGTSFPMPLSQGPALLPSISRAST